MTNGSVSAGTCVLLVSPVRDNAMVEWISRAAQEQGYVTTSPDAKLAPGVSLLDSIASSIQHAAIVVAMLSRGHDALKRHEWGAYAAAWFELGIAVAAHKPVLVVLSDDDLVLPRWASGLPTIGPRVGYEGLLRAMRQAVRRASGVPEPNPARTGLPLGAAAAELEAAFNELPRTAGGGGSGPAFEEWFSDLLGKAEVPFEQSSSVDDEDLPRAYRSLDFVVSVDELTANLGDLLPVELALGPADPIVRGRRKTFRAYMRATGARAALVVSASTEQATTIWSIGSGDVLACSGLTLVREMQSATFGEAIVVLRNSARSGAEIT